MRREEWRVLLLLAVRESEGENLEELSYDEGFCSCLKGLIAFEIIGNVVLVCKSELGRESKLDPVIVIDMI